jgi:hypothetical protein
MLNVKGKRLNVWLPEGYDEKIKELLDLLDKQGVDLRDSKKGGLSQSALIRHLVDEARKKAGMK